MSVKNLSLKMKSYDDIFGNNNDDATDSVVELNTNELHYFPDHPFQIRDDDDMRDLIADIAENGVLFPIEVYVEDGKYYIISGHRRTFAATKCGLSTVPAIIKNVTKSQAVKRMVSANRYRTNISPIEKGKAYKMELEAIKEEKRLNPNKNGLRSDSELAAIVGDSRANIQRYIRLTTLTEDWQMAVEEGELGVTPAQPLAQMSISIQNHIYDVWSKFNKPKLNATITSDLHVAWKNNDEKLSTNDICVIMGIFTEAKPKPRKIAFSEKKLNKYFPANMKQDEIEVIVEELLREWAADHGYNPDGEEDAPVKGQMKITDTDCNMIEE